MISLHILFIPSWYPCEGNPLLGSFFREQIEALKESGLQVGVLAPSFVDLPSKGWAGSRSSKPKLTIENQIPVVRATHRFIQPGPFHRIPFVYNATLRARHALGEQMFECYVDQYGKPDLIHAQGVFWGGTIATHLAEKAGIPSMITEHSSVIARGIAGPRERKSAIAAYNQADRCTAVSQSAAKDLETILNLPPDSFEITPNMVDFKHFETQNDRANQDSPFIWLSVGNLTDGKGLRTALEAFSRTESSILQIAGGGPLLDELSQQAEALGIADRVQFLGPVPREEIADLFANANGLVHCSEYETFGIVILEAIASELKIVCTDSGGPRELLENTPYDLVRIGDVEAISSAMIRFESESIDTQSIRIQTETIYSMEAFCERLQQAYSNLLDEK